LTRWWKGMKWKKKMTKSTIELPVARKEIGFTRTTCGCKKCQVWCKHQPGFLVPSDLDRLIPQDEDPYQWAEKHLRASPGLRIVVSGLTVSIPSIVPAKQENGHCHWFQGGNCLVHTNLTTRLSHGARLLDSLVRRRTGSVLCTPASGSTFRTRA
jgi:hypothetical protein